jgi:uncharacterized protein YqeY
MKNLVYSVRIKRMTIKEQLDADIKQAMLDGDKALTTILRTLKSAALNAEVAAGIRDQGLSDEAFIELLTKEAKKRQESADMYVQGGSKERADAELAEKKIIEKYLPVQLSDTALQTVVSGVIDEMGVTGMQAMGQVIAEVKKRTAGQADGGRITAAVKASLGQ